MSAFVALEGMNRQAQNFVCKPFGDELRRNLSTLIGICCLTMRGNWIVNHRLDAALSETRKELVSGRGSNHEKVPGWFGMIRDGLTHY